MDDCIFCKIIKGEIPASKIDEDADTFTFYDLHPQAEKHALVIGKHHVDCLSQHDALTDRELAACLRACARVAEKLGIQESGYRVVTNTGRDACQSVGHMHFHVLGGEQLDPGLTGKPYAARE